MKCNAHSAKSAACVRLRFPLEMGFPAKNIISRAPLAIATSLNAKMMPHIAGLDVFRPLMKAMYDIVQYHLKKALSEKLLSSSSYANRVLYLQKARQDAIVYFSLTIFLICS